MEASDEPPVFLERGARATRGKRLRVVKLWLRVQDAASGVERKRMMSITNKTQMLQMCLIVILMKMVQKKKRLIYPGKPTNKKKKKKKDLSKLDGDSKKEKLDAKSPPRAHQDAHDDVEGEKTVRKSTRTSVIVRQAERAVIQAALQATMKPIKRKKEGEEKRMTQEEMLLEAAQTGCSYLEFSKGASFAAEISTKSIPYPEKAVCAVTGLPAKYRDPKTGLPYATKEAFKIIRERHALVHLNNFQAENSDTRKDMDMGAMFDSLPVKGFVHQRKRSQVTTITRVSNFRFSEHFRRTQTVEIEISD